ncbi:hypothetical protein [Agrobacterium rubi]|uniref:hypothetical protein n=1 Tax=Agrobacterium rubi TaxID=28099 RepID=UPI003B967C1F
MTAAKLVWLLSACAQTSMHSTRLRAAAVDPRVQAMYGVVQDGGGLIPAVDVAKMDPKNVRQFANYRTGYALGTIVVYLRARFLYLVMENEKAMRYGVGVAKAGLEFTGRGGYRA